MPSFLHEILVDLFRKRPVLARELLAAGAGIQLGGAVAEPASIDLSQVAPSEYRSDAVTVLRNRRRDAIAAVITEVQLGVDADKRRTWPLYIAAARASLGCPVTLLVLAPDRAVARWARRPIHLGHPGYTLRPLVIGYERIPRVTDLARAREAPQLAVLSAIAHPYIDVAEAALAALDGLPEDDQKLYWDVILNGLPALVRQALEARMIKGYQYQSDFARKYYGQGLEEGQRKGLEEGQRKGLEEGQRKGLEEGQRKGLEEGQRKAREELRRVIVDGVSVRLPGLRDELASRLRDQPEAVLGRVAMELGGARDEAAARAVLDRVLERRA